MLKNRRKLLQYLQLSAGALLFSAATNLFVAPGNLNAGGIVGLAQIFSFLISNSTRLTGIINFLINVPLMVLSYRGISRGFFCKTVTALVLQSIFLTVIPVPQAPIMPDPLSNVIIGAFVGGLGIGLSLLASGSLGGMDILGVYTSSKAPDLSVAKLSYIVNLFVLGWSAFLFNMVSALYSLLFIVITYYVSDQVHYQNINVYTIIITKNPQIRDEIMKAIHRGVTYWYGKGAYTGSETEILLCIMNRYEIRTVKKIVHRMDPKAFFLISRGNPVLGNFEKHLIF